MLPAELAELTLSIRSMGTGSGSVARGETLVDALRWLSASRAAVKLLVGEVGAPVFALPMAADALYLRSQWYHTICMCFS